MSPAMMFRLIRILTVFICIFVLSPTNALPHNRDTVALVMKALSNPFFSRMEEGARNYAHEEGITLEVFGVERETDVERQIGILENLIAREYGAIIIAPTDSVRLVPICKKAIERGIRVINIDNPLHKPTMKTLGVAIPFIGPDNYAGGQMIGEYMKKKLNGKGRILVIEGIHGVENAEDRKNGFLSAVTNESSIEIVSSQSANWHTDEAFSVAAEMLKENRPIDAVFCANDSMAIGVLQAIDHLAITKPVFITGYDNIESIRAEIRNGNVHATIEQHPELMGAYGVEAARNLMEGTEVALSRSIPLDLITYETFGKKIVFSVSTMQNPFFSTMAENAKNAAVLFGMDLIILDADNQDALQLVDITNALSKKPDMLIINPTNTESIIPGIEFAKEKNIPVITVDRKATTGSILSHIESDNTAGGRLAADFIASIFTDKANIMEIEGIPGTSATHERGEGFNLQLGKYDHLKVSHREVANFDQAEAKTVMLRFLKSGKPVDGIFAHNDNMILGVIEAYTEAKVPLPKVLIGFDAIPAAKRSIKQNQLTATIAQRPDLMGHLAMQTASRFFRGERIPPRIPVKLKLITQ